jgi:lysophospholipase L1-like esterase
MTPLGREIGGTLRDYEHKARQRLVDFTKTQQITYIDFLPVFNATETPQNFYRDHIHLSPQGNQKVSEVLTRSLQQLLPPQSQPNTATDMTSSD